MTPHSQQRLLAQLATSDNELASGLGQCLEALRLISALPRASPVFVKYAVVDGSSPVATKAFGREHLSRVPLRTVIALIKSSFSLPDPIQVASALFFREDGTIDPAPVLVDEDSWKELAPYVHTLHVEDAELRRALERRPSTALSVISPGSPPPPLPPPLTVSISSVQAVGGVANGAAGGASSPPSLGRSSGLNSNATTFIPAGSSNGISIKTGESTKLGLRKPSFSPSSSSQPTSPFAILDNTGTCV